MDILNEIAEWEKEGIISQEQAQILQARYQAEAQHAPLYRRLSFWLSTAAVTLMALGAFLLISENWERFPIPVRVLMGLVPLLLSYGLTVFLSTKEKPLATEVAGLFSALLFGLNIQLQAQIFHISSYYPDGILWWLLGVFPLMVLFHEGIVFFLGLLLFTIWLGANLVYEHFQWLSVPLMLLVIGLFIRKQRAFNLPLLLLACFLFSLQVLLPNLSHYEPEELMVYFVAFCNIAAVGTLYLSDEQYGTRFLSSMRFLLTLPALWLLFAFTFNFGGTEGDVLYLLSAVLMVLSFALGYNRWDEFKHLLPIFIPTVLYILYALAGGKTDADGFLYGWNALYIAVCIAVCWLALEYQQRGRFFMGVGLIMIWALGRYIDKFNDYLVGGLLLIACGALMLGINHVWNKCYNTTTNTQNDALN